MTKLLIHEPPLQVLPSLAEAIGLNEAIIIQQLHYWLENPKAGKEQDGYKWVFNTYDEWHEQFPFWSTNTIQRIFSSLEKSNIVIAEQLNKQSHDMTKFYRINYDELCKMEHTKMVSSKTPNRYDVKRNTENPSQISEEDEAETTFKTAWSFFTNNICPTPTPFDAELFGDLVDEHSPKWTIEAMKIAVARNARNIKFFDAILKRWKTEGYGTEYPKQNGGKRTNGKNHPNSKAPEPDDYLEKLEAKRERLRKQMEGASA